MKLDWPENVKTMQRNWIGKSSGAEIKYQLEDSDDSLLHFQQGLTLLFGVSFLAISPNHTISIDLAKNNESITDFLLQCKETDSC